MTSKDQRIRPRHHPGAVLFLMAVSEILVPLWRCLLLFRNGVCTWISLGGLAKGLGHEVWYCVTQTDQRLGRVFGSLERV